MDLMPSPVTEISRTLTQPVPGVPPTVSFRYFASLAVKLCVVSPPLGELVVSATTVHFLPSVEVSSLCG